MARVSEKFGGAYLKAEHLNGQPRIVTIETINDEIVYDKDTCVVYFTDEPRGLKLSMTCARDIVEVLGDDEMENWKGRTVELYCEARTITDRDTQIEKSILMIRARPPSSGAATPKPPTTDPRAGLDDL